MIFKHQSKKGFTLIELLVVISIISLLSSVILASLNAARAKARAVQRLSDMRQVQIAVENYFADTGSYPNTGDVWQSQCAGWGGVAANNVVPGLVPTYMPSFPADPKMDVVNNKSCYIYRSDGKNYAFLDHDVPELESSPPNYSSYPAFIDPARDSGPNACVVDGGIIWAWKVSSPGDACI